MSPLTIDTLIVRRPIELERRPSGLLRPELFRAEEANLGVPAPLTGGLTRRPDGLLTVGGAWSRTRRFSADQEYAVAYQEACKKLTESTAGQRATELLFSQLSPDQVDTARRYGHFDQTIYDGAAAELTHRVGRPVGFHTLRVRFLRAYPNGNILLTDPRPDAVEYRVCLHPVEPYPIDDICLAQWMLLMTDPDEFIRAGNITEPGQTRHQGFVQMFDKWRVKGPSDLVLSQVKQPPVPDNVILADG